MCYNPLALALQKRGAAMQTFEKWMRGLALVGQLGFCVITPPLVLTWLARLLVEKCGWGYWIVVTALIVGILSGLSSAWSLLRPKKPKEPPQRRVYFDHHS